jgi:hypothetical protein
VSEAVRRGGHAGQAPAEDGLAEHQTEHITLCLFDVLGISEKIKKGELEKIYNLYKDLAETTSRLNGQACWGVEPSPDGRLFPVGFVGNIKSAYFSDTYIIWELSQRPRVQAFVDTCMKLFCQSLELGVPLRGCISSGEAIMDNEKRLYLGQPLVEAARGEHLQKWLGFSFGDTFRMGLHWDSKMFIPYRGHLKAGLQQEQRETLSPFVVDWARYWREKKAGNVSELIKKMDTESEFSDYYANTLTFVAFSEKHQAWWTEADFHAENYADLCDKAGEWLDRVAT